MNSGDRIIPTINRLVAAVQAAGGLVVYTQDWHPEATPHFQKDGGMWPVHCVADSWGAQFHPGLDVEGPVLRKGTGGEDGYSGFSMREVTTGSETPTGLHELLKERGTIRIIVVGLAQDVCVKETVLDGRRLGYEAVVPLTATRAVNLEPGDARRASEAMLAAGAIVH